MNIDIYVIKSEHLKKRNMILSNTLNTIVEIMKKIGYTINITNIFNPTVPDIETNIVEYNKSINLNPDDITDPEFKKLQTKFNLAQLSNLYKHRKAYEMIKDSKTKHNFIIEDDIILLPEYIENFTNFIKKLSSYEYDILLACLSNNEEKEPMDIVMSTVYFKVLISKCAYFITPSIGQKLYDYLEVVRFPLKLSLSKYIFDNKSDICAYILNKHTILEGSKLGIFTTSINSNNFLLQNINFIRFIEMLNNNENDIKKIEEHYNNFGKDNSDFQHILGLIYFKNNKFKEAVEILKIAVLNCKNSEGYMIQNNELLNNAINIYQHYQDDIKDCFAKEGIYSYSS
jgi:GR25 family glycosyltransferase involved in LPS biosynthesis